MGVNVKLHLYAGLLLLAAYSVVLIVGAAWPGVDLGRGADREPVGLGGRRPPEPRPRAHISASAAPVARLARWMQSGSELRALTSPASPLDPATPRRRGRSVAGRRRADRAGSRRPGHGQDADPRRGAPRGHGRSATALARRRPRTGLLDAAPRVARRSDAVDAGLPSGWQTATEVTFNIRHERGSIDILAFHEATGSLLVIEIKTVVPDLQGTLGTLDRKVRVATQIAAERGWVVKDVSRTPVSCPTTGPLVVASISIEPRSRRSSRHARVEVRVGCATRRSDGRRAVRAR